VLAVVLCCFTYLKKHLVVQISFIAVKETL
jgi:hypothetical protein